MNRPRFGRKDKEPILIAYGMWIIIAIFIIGCVVIGLKNGWT